MIHSNTTNLLKGFLIPALVGTLILSFVLLSCGNQPNTQAPCPVLGKWQVKDIETSQSRELDPETRKIYQQELNKMLESSFLLLSTDSTYQLNMGGQPEKGRWKWDAKDSLLLLQVPGRPKRYYTIQPNGQQSFKLRQELDPGQTTLIIASLPH